MANQNLKTSGAESEDIGSHVILDDETRQRLLKIRDQLADEIGFKPNVRQMVKYLIHNYDIGGPV